MKVRCLKAFYSALRGAAAIKPGMSTTAAVAECGGAAAARMQLWHAAAMQGSPLFVATPKAAADGGAAGRDPWVIRQAPAGPSLASWPHHHVVRMGKGEPTPK